MKGWATFYTILGVLVLIASGLNLLFLSIGLAVSLFIAAMSLFTVSSFCDRITEILENQAEILKILKPEEQAAQNAQHANDVQAEEKAEFDMFEQ